MTGVTHPPSPLSLSSSDPKVNWAQLTSTSARAGVRQGSTIISGRATDGRSPLIDFLEINTSPQRSFHSPRCRRFTGQDGRQYCWSYRTHEDHEWTCVDASNTVVAFYNLKTPGEPRYAYSSGCMLTVEEQFVDMACGSYLPSSPFCAQWLTKPHRQNFLLPASSCGISQLTTSRSCPSAFGYRRIPVSH